MGVTAFKSSEDYDELSRTIVVKELSPEMEDMLSDASKPGVTREVARFLLAFGSLRQLVKGKENAKPIKGLFRVPDWVPDPVPKAWAKEVNSKGWQRDFLGRLVAAGIVQKVNYFYYVDDFSDIKDIAYDAISAEGRMLKYFVWPGDYPDPYAEVEPEEDDDPVEESSEPPEESSESVGVSDVLTLVQEIANQMATMASSLARISQLSEENSRSIQRMNSTVASSHAVMEGHLAKILEAVDVVRELTESGDRRAMRELLVRYRESSDRNKSLMRQLEAATNREEKITGQVGRVLSALVEETDQNDG